MPTTVPANAPKPQDHKPPRKRTAAARRAEANGNGNGNGNGRIEIEQRGVVLTIPRDHGQWPLATIEYFADGNHVKGIKSLVGAEVWQELIDAGATASDLNEIGEKFQDALGLDSGE